MACFGGGGGGSSGTKAALNTASDPMLASKAFLEVRLTLGNVNTKESVLLLNTQGEYLPGSQGNDSSAKKPPKKPDLPPGKLIHYPLN